MWVDSGGTIARIDLTDRDIFLAHLRPPRDHYMTRFVERHRAQAVVSSDFHGGYQGGAEACSRKAYRRSNAVALPTTNCEGL